MATWVKSQRVRVRDSMDSVVQGSGHADVSVSGTLRMGDGSRPGGVASPYIGSRGTCARPSGRGGVSGSLKGESAASGQGCGFAVHRPPKGMRRAPASGLWESGARAAPIVGLFRDLNVSRDGARLRSP
ncbi:hypothetical protein Ssi02_19960 [Sinosporangium siamense]|uniref:Uncharacterized protein n=1 Tax=Sinosporangium siamense TaxID=1367973 RepID=A0A919RD79_9ACTN|nr:hypothetical protein Ssi02_19960 [Sinosporangium siamense]